MNEIDTKLYELFADKTLSEGCEIRLQSKYPSGSLGEGGWNEDGGEYTDVIKKMNENDEFVYDCEEFPKSYIENNSDDDDYAFTILGHEPQLHDVFRVAREKLWKCEILDAETIGYKDIVVINGVWIEYNPTLPLINQTDETKQSIINLFK